jgi:hypothetical protein
VAFFSLGCWSARVHALTLDTSYILPEDLRFLQWYGSTARTIRPGLAEQFLDAEQLNKKKGRDVPLTEPAIIGRQAL